MGAFFLVGIVVLFFLLPKIQFYLAGRSKTVNQSAITFLIDRPLTAEELAKALEKKQIIADRTAFLRVANYKKLDKERIALGKYVIAPETNFRSLLNGFTKNKSGNGNAEQEVTVTFNNCRTIYSMAGKVADCLILDSAELIQYLLSDTTLKKFGFSVDQIPTMFIPNSYKFYFDTDARAFTERMAKEFKTFWNPQRMAKITKIGLTSPSEVVTLASIVYAEQSRNADEWPTIAGLYLNRIRTGMKLQSDPTFKFCWGDKLDGVQRLLAVHRNIDCPYNTYKIQGLPPGPINLPSTSVVDAVLDAPKVDYLFMCAKPDFTGRHNFAVSDKEHLRNAKIFQDWMDAGQKNPNPRQ